MPMAAFSRKDALYFYNNTVVSYLYCDVSLPVPVDQLFTYALPETLRHRVKAGCRLMVPFGPRKMTGVALRCHDEVPEMATREALRLIDSEPVLDEQLLALGKWIAGYYCAPLGEVLRAMLPLAAEIRSGKIYSLTDSGRDAARQLLLDAAPEDGVAAVLRMLEARPLSAAYLAKKAPLGLRLSLAVNSSMAWPSYQAANRPRSLWYPRTVTGKDGCRRKSIRDLYFGGSEVGGL